MCMIIIFPNNISLKYKVGLLIQYRFSNHSSFYVAITMFFEVYHEVKN